MTFILITESVVWSRCRIYFKKR